MMTKRVLSLLLTLVMVLSLGAPAFAADEFEAEAPAEVVEEAPAAPVEPEAPEAEVAEEPVAEEPVAEEPVEEPVEEPAIAAIIAEEPADVPMPIGVDPAFDPNGKAAKAFLAAYDDIAVYMQDGKLNTEKYRVPTLDDERSEELLADLFTKATGYADYLREGKPTKDDVSEGELSKVTEALKAYMPKANMAIEKGCITDRVWPTNWNKVFTQDGEGGAHKDIGDVLEDKDQNIYPILSADGTAAGTAKTDTVVLGNIDDKAIEALDETNGVAVTDAGFDFIALYVRPPFYTNLQKVVKDILDVEKLYAENNNDPNATEYVTIEQFNELKKTIEKWAYNGDEVTKAKTLTPDDYDTLTALMDKAEALNTMVGEAEEGVYTTKSVETFNAMYAQAVKWYGEAAGEGGLKTSSFRVWYTAYMALTILTSEEDSVLVENTVTGAIWERGVVKADLTAYTVTFARDAEKDDNEYAYTYSVNGQTYCDAAKDYDDVYTAIEFGDSANTKTADLAPLTDIGTAADGGTEFEGGEKIHVTMWLKGEKEDWSDAAIQDEKDFAIEDDAYSGPMFELDDEGNVAVEWLGDPDYKISAKIDRASEDIVDKYAYMFFQLSGPGGVYETTPHRATSSAWSAGVDWAEDLDSWVNVEDEDPDTVTLDDVLAEAPGTWTLSLWMQQAKNETVLDHDWADVEIPSIVNYGAPDPDDVADEDAEAVGFPALVEMVSETKELLESDVIVPDGVVMNLETAKAKVQAAVDEAETYVNGAEGKAYVDSQVKEVERLKGELEKVQGYLVRVAVTQPLEDLIEEIKAAYDPDDYTNWDDMETAIEAAEEFLAEPHATEEEADVKDLQGETIKVDGAIAEEYAKLVDAVGALKPAADPQAIKDLTRLIAEAKEKAEDESLTADGKAALEDAIDAAQEVLDKEGVLPSELHGAIDDLRDAMDNVETKGDKTALTKAIEDAQKIVAAKADYTEESWTNAGLEAALEAAQAVAEDENATQDEIDEAVAGLEAAEAALVTVAYDTAMKELMAKIDEAGDQWYINPTEELQAAVLEATSALLSGERTPETLKAATEELDKAIKANKDDLAAQVEALKAEAEKAVADYAENENVTAGTKDALKAIADNILAMEAEDVTAEDVEVSTAALESVVEAAKADIAQAQADAKAAAKDALDAAIKAAEEQNGKFETRELTAAIEKAQGIADNAESTTEELKAAKTELDEAVADNKKAEEADIAAKVEAAQKDLAAAIEAAKAEAEKNHTDEFKQALDAAIEAAEALKESTDQKTLEDATAALNAAMEGAAADTEKKDAADKEAAEKEAAAAAKAELDAAIAEAEKLAEADYTAETWTGFNAALDAAKAASAKADATKAELDAAKAALADAQGKLAKKPVEPEGPKPTGTGKEWVVYNGDYYYFEGGKMVTSAWIGGNAWYHLGADGKMDIGFTHVQDGNKDDGWYYFQETNDNGCIGATLSGWQDTGVYGWGYFETRHNGNFGKCTYTGVQGDYKNYLAPVA